MRHTQRRKYRKLAKQLDALGSGQNLATYHAVMRTHSSERVMRGSRYAQHCSESNENACTEQCKPTYLIKSRGNSLRNLNS